LVGERKTVNLNLPQHEFRVPFALYLFICLFAMWCW